MCRVMETAAEYGWLMSQLMKLWETVEDRLAEEVNICEQQGFIPTRTLQMYLF